MDLGQRNIARAWLVLGIGALLASGVFSVLLVASRTPAVQDFIPIIDFFHTALVVHVDLSVLIWFLALGGVVWSVTSAPRVAAAEWGALMAAALGTVLVTLSAFAPDPRPLINNYVPVLQQPLFFAGLTLFGLGCVVKCMLALAGGRARNGPAGNDRALCWGGAAAAVITLIACAALAATWLVLPGGERDARYFETLFWGPGHTLQFTFTLLLLLAWYWLSTVIYRRPPVGGERLGAWLLAVAALPAFLGAPWILLTAPPGSAASTAGFARLMVLGGLFALPSMTTTLVAVVRGGIPADTRPEWSALWCSIALFVAGGVLGFMIRGVNVVIPAHYHGSIVGVTLALVGLTYHLLPALGYRRPAPRMATWQPVVYGGGQLLHILGLAISGGYGNVQRKTAGAAQGLDSLPDLIGMGMMGLGGLVAIIGGLLFVVVVIRAMWPAPRT